MALRILFALLVMVTAVILWLLPVGEAIYDYRTIVRSDAFENTDTAVGVTTADVTLLRAIYDNDTETITYLSSISTDSPAFSSYNTTTRLLTVSGLTANTTRTLTIGYDVNALTAVPAVDTFADYLPTMWMIVIAIYPMAALAGIFFGGRA